MTAPGQASSRPPRRVTARCTARSRCCSWWSPPASRWACASSAADPGLSRSTTSRTLGILAELGMVERTADGGARPGAALATLTRRVEQSPAVLRDRFRPLAAEMRRVYGENAAVGIDDGSGFLYLASARVPAAVQVADPTGQSYTYHLDRPRARGDGALAGRSSRRLPGRRRSSGPRRTRWSEPAAIRRRLAADPHAPGTPGPTRSSTSRSTASRRRSWGPSGGLLAVATLYGPVVPLRRVAAARPRRRVRRLRGRRAAPLAGR